MYNMLLFMQTNLGRRKGKLTSMANDGPVQIELETRALRGRGHAPFECSEVPSESSTYVRSIQSLHEPLIARIVHSLCMVYQKNKAV